MNEKKIIEIVSKAINSKVNPKSSWKNTPAWDSLGHLSVVSSFDKITKGKSSKIDLSNADSIKKLCIKLKTF